MITIPLQAARREKQWASQARRGRRKAWHPSWREAIDLLKGEGCEKHQRRRKQAEKRMGKQCLLSSSVCACPEERLWRGERKEAVSLMMINVKEGRKTTWPPARENDIMYSLTYWNMMTEKEADWSHRLTMIGNTYYSVAVRQLPAFLRAASERGPLSENVSNDEKRQRAEGRGQPNP